MCFYTLYSYLSGENYYLHDVGKKRCHSGSGLFDTTECKKACIELGIPLSGRKFKNGKSCYKGGSNVCNQNGGLGRRASLVCKREGNLISTMMTAYTTFYKNTYIYMILCICMAYVERRLLF